MTLNSFRMVSSGTSRSAVSSATMLRNEAEKKVTQSYRVLSRSVIRSFRIDFLVWQLGRVHYPLLMRGSIIRADSSYGQIDGHLEKFLSPSRRESDSVTSSGHGRMERADHGAEGLFRC